MTLRLKLYGQEESSKGFGRPKVDLGKANAKGSGKSHQRTEIGKVWPLVLIHGVMWVLCSLRRGGSRLGRLTIEDGFPLVGLVK